MSLGPYRPLQLEDHLMIISKTPFRISFFGGGTDYPTWYRERGGSVLGTTIDKYCYVSCRNLPPFFDHRIRVVYSAIELASKLDDIKHPAVRETLRFLKMVSGVEIHHDADLPARAGIGSSSAFTVGLLNALYALQGRMTSKYELAKQAIHVEQNMIRENVGSQDQTMTAYGGLNYVRFHTNDDISVTPVTLTPRRTDEFQSHLMLFFTGLSRTASQVAGQIIQDMPKRTDEMTMMHKLVDEALSILTSRQDICDFGRLLHENWILKRSLSAVISKPEIDAVYEKARSAGALGGKLLGAGGGGFLLLFVKPEDQDNVRRALHSLLHVPFKFESSGSNIVVYEPSQLAQAA
jgi:D-glycero-alpha-D-manno-heptose-7-phosphate kinase